MSAEHQAEMQAVSDHPGVGVGLELRAFGEKQISGLSCDAKQIRDFQELPLNLPHGIDQRALDS